MTNELIKITYENDNPTVSGRDLHTQLEIGTEYMKWFERQCEYGFVEGVDFSSVLTESTGGRPATDHRMSIPMAKEIAMIQRTEIGKQIRQYLIRLEEAWNTPEMVMSRALKMAARTIDALQAETRRQEVLLEEVKPKALFADAVATSKTSILVGELAKLLKQNGIEIGQNRLFGWLREKGYLIRRQGTDYNMPTQRSMEQELFEIKETSVVHSDGHTSVNKTPKVTGKGQLYFINLFLSDGVA